MFVRRSADPQVHARSNDGKYGALSSDQYETIAKRRLEQRKIRSHASERVPGGCQYLPPIYPHHTASHQTDSATSQSSIPDKSRPGVGHKPDRELLTGHVLLSSSVKLIGG